VNRLRSLALVLAVAMAGAAGTLVAAAAAGMPSADVAHLALLLIPATLTTLVAVAAARPLLSRAPFRHRLVAVGLVSAVVALTNLSVLATLMFFSEHDTLLLAVLLVYSTGAGVGTALVLARASSRAVDRLAATAGALAEGHLDARAGDLGDGGPELRALGETLDRMADRLQRAMAREREVESRRRDLITAVSHDLRTPLASLRAMVESIEDGVVDDPPTLRRYIGEMRRSVDALVLLVDDLFELAQLDAGAILAETERARVEDVVRSALAACEGQARLKGLVVRADLDGVEDALCSPRLVRVLQNLLQNAIRHTPADGTVRIEAARTPAGLRMAVEDTGEGIQPEVLSRVFDPFWRGDPARTGAGAGLGLALAKRIVEALGGRIEAHSQPARGSLFAVLIPDRATGGPPG
jgi:signal transduction histidine kinase